MQLPAGLLSRKNCDFWKFWTCPESKSMHFLKFGHFLKNGSPGQTTMLTRRAAKFCVEPRSPFSYISHHDPKTLAKRLIIVSWPECRPEFPRDDDGGGGGGGFPRTLDIWRSPVPTCPGTLTLIVTALQSAEFASRYQAHSALRWTLWPNNGLWDI